MNPRERFNAVVNHREPDRVPIDWGRHVGSIHRNGYAKLAAYLNDSRLLVEQIRTAVESHDATALSPAAHRLKSSSAQLGALATAGHCKELETLGRLTRIDEAAHLLSQLIEAHQFTCTAITSELQQRSPR